MTGTTVQFSSDFSLRSSATRLSTKNAWALYARRRWPQNGVKLAMAEWGLTEGEAKGLYAAQISQPTIDKIIDHKRGGFGLGLLILEIRCQTGLRAWVQSERERAADEARRHAADAAAFGQMASDVAALVGMDAPGPDGLGERRARERRTYRG